MNRRFRTHGEWSWSGEAKGQRGDCGRAGAHPSGAAARLRVTFPLVRVSAALLLSAVIAACTSGDRIVTIQGTGVIQGQVYKDVDGNRSPGGSTDEALSGIRIGLLVAGTIDTPFAATSDANGRFSFGAVPVGRYLVTVAAMPAIFGDSLQVVRIDTSDIALGVDDSSDVAVAVSFPAYAIATARQLVVGKKIFVTGLALSNSTTFGDATFSLADTTGAIRIAGTSGPTVAVGDSVRVLGRTGARDGQPVVAEGQVTVLGVGGLPVAERVSTQEAATADAGRLDAALVKIVDGTITDSATVAGDYVVTVDDGSGAVLVLFDQDAGLTRAPYVPGVLVDVTGVLVADGVGGWRLKPRSNNDLVVK